MSAFTLVTKLVKRGAPAVFARVGAADVVIAEGPRSVADSGQVLAGCWSWSAIASASELSRSVFARLNQYRDPVSGPKCR